ncbi:MAG TPA: LysR family transcriptional regulator [Gemmatimonadaceae bacterium]|nr:LysR family transcriptional regulator [Gemmatimonadaceae bacterium]
MMKLETRHLRLVVGIADFGSLTRAGHQLHLTQSALSHQLSDLEAQLGVRLFDRMGKRMEPTAAGERLIARARIALQQLREMEHEVKQIASGRDAVIRVATECYTCYHWLPQLLKAFGERYPKVEIQIVPGATARPIRALLAGKIDVCIVLQLPRDRRVEGTPLFDDELVAVVAPTHPLASRAYLEAADFATEHLLNYSPPEESHLYQRLLTPAGVVPRQLSLIQLTEAMIELTKAGMGIAALARWAVEPHVRAGTLRAIPLTPTGLQRRWYSATRASKNKPVYLSEFEQFVAKAVTGEPELAHAVGKLSLVS